MATSKVVAILGGTGKTGKFGVKGALQKGHNVRILARNPDKVKTIFNYLFGEEEGAAQFEKVTVVKGGVKDEEAIKELVTGADVVVSFLGMTESTTWVVEPGIKQIMSAMKDSGSSGKLVCLSAMGVRDSWYQTRASHWILGPLTAYVIIPLFLKNIYADMEAAEKLMEEEWGKEGGLTTTIVRAPVLKDDQHTSLTTRTRRLKTITTPPKICSRGSSLGGWTAKMWPLVLSTASTPTRTTTRMSLFCKNDLYAYIFA